MAQINIEQLSNEIIALKEEMIELKARVGEEYELSDWAKKELARSRSEMKKDFVSHKDMLKRFG